jgi:trehalose 6-phosphate phosphatase
LPVSPPANIPLPFPHGLLNDIAARSRLLLMLDYDGTIAPIVSDPAAAWPLNEAREALLSLAARRDRIDLAVISGRGLSELGRLLGVPRGIYLAGVHGLELADPDGRREVVAGLAAALPQLERARRWLRERVPGGSGLVVEDKRLAVALHYRNADPALAKPLVDEFERFVTRKAGHLILKRGKQVSEAAPRAADKGAAVMRLMERVGASVLPVYFGDDLTDEDAFRALAGRGVTVMVEGAGASAARYRVESPAAVAAILGGLAAAMEAL